jgi:hypothetical protein
MQADEDSTNWVQRGKLGPMGKARAIFHSKAINSLSAWLGVSAAGIGVITYMIPEWFGALTLAQRAVIGLGAALAFTLVFAIVLALVAYAFRKMWPHNKQSSSEQEAA